MTFIDNHDVICIDWNGVLDTYQGYQNGRIYPLRDGAKAFLTVLVEKGYRIVILTAANVDVVHQWTIDVGINHLISEITNIKVPAILYIDDRAITFRGDFYATLMEILTFKVFWDGDTNT